MTYRPPLHAGGRARLFCGDGVQNIVGSTLTCDTDAKVAPEELNLTPHPLPMEHSYPPRSE
ncbi:MAG: hypothetical protein ACPHEP_13005, partial [Acidimicrobiales bacterium]